jgi:hypothetical protein
MAIYFSRRKLRPREAGEGGELNIVPARGAVVAAAGGDARAPSLPRTLEGAYDFEGLTRKMIEVKAAFPGASHLILAGDPEVEYRDVVRTMDATRETPDHRLLFNDNSLAQM